MRSNTKQACDACRRRKVRCDGTQPCLHCTKAALKCTFLLIPQKKGRQGEKANVISELRAAQARAQQINSDIPNVDHVTAPQPRPRLAHFSRSSGLLPLDLVNACTEFFFTHMHSTVPILQREQFQREIISMNESTEAYCLVLCLCAFVIIQTGAVGPSFPIGDESPSVAGLKYGQALLDEALEARKCSDILARPTIRIITITFFLYCCHIGLHHQKHAWYFLREATTLYLSGPVEANSDSEGGNSLILSRLFWLLLISERAHAIRRRLPITLHITPDIPAADVQENEGPPLSGFGYLATLFSPFDEIFLGLWNRTHLICSQVSLVNLEAHIQQTVPPSLDISDTQLANLRITQQWLRIIIWQLSNTLEFLSSSSIYECMTFRYPLQIARDLAFATWKLPQQSMEIHGPGLLEKIFEVACTLTDVISCIPPAETKSSGFELGPEDYLKHFFSLIFKLRGGKNKFLPLLMSKVEQTLPGMVNPIARHLDMPIESGENMLPRGSRCSEDKQISDIRMNGESNRSSGAETTGSATRAFGFKLPETGHEFSIVCLRENRSRHV